MTDLSPLDRLVEKWASTKATSSVSEVAASVNRSRAAELEAALSTRLRDALHALSTPSKEECKNCGRPRESKSHATAEELARGNVPSGKHLFQEPVE